MNTSRTLFCLVSLGLSSFLAVPLLAAEKGKDADSSAANKPGTLQVQVNVPPTWRPMLEEDISDAFVADLAEVFRRQGYEGEIAEVRWFDEPSPGCCLLTINLTEWRMNHIGNIECTFTANLQTEQTTRHLGIFTGMAFRWMSGPGRFGLADSFHDAAEDALRPLYRALARTDLVPGAKQRSR